MKVHVRFRQGLDAYPKGTSHYLPDDLADHYIRAGVAELVDNVPAVVVVTEPKPPAVEVEETPAADEPEAEVSETETDADTATTTRSKRRKS